MTIDKKESTVIPILNIGDDKECNDDSKDNNDKERIYCVIDLKAPWSTVCV